MSDSASATQFVHISNLFLPATIDDCHQHDGVGLVPGVKTTKTTKGLPPARARARRLPSGGLKRPLPAQTGSSLACFRLARVHETFSRSTDSNGTVTMNGTGVTLVFTSADGTYPTASNPIMNIPNAMTLNLTAPTSGSTAGFVIMGDTSMPLGTVGQNNSTPTGSQTRFDNGATGTLNGVVYVPGKGALSTIGNGQMNSTGCLQDHGQRLQLRQPGGFTSACTGSGVNAPSVLVGACRFSSNETRGYGECLL